MRLFDTIKALIDKDYKNSVMRDKDIGGEEAPKDENMMETDDFSDTEEDGISWIDLFAQAARTSSGEIITPENAFRNIGVVFACVDRRARALAKLPLQVYRKDGQRREPVIDHRVSELLGRRPNKYQTPTMFKQFIVASQLLWGNAFILKEYGGKGQINALIPLYPSEVSIQKIVDREEYLYNYNGRNYTEDEMIHIPYLSSNGKVGVAPLSVAREAAGTLQSMNKHQGAFYKNGALRQGALIVPGQISSSSKDKLRKEWSQKTGGAQNSGNVAVLDAGMDWKDISMPLQDAEFVASKKLSATEIATIFDVPAYMINDTEKMTYSNMEQQNDRWVLDVIQPDCIHIEEEFNYKLFLEKEADMFVKFNLSAGLRSDPKTRAAFYKEMLGMGVYSVNEIRTKEDLDGIGELGDKHYMSLNYTTLDTLEEYQRGKTSGKGGEG